MTADFRHSESGTELLARLKGRSSLKNLEPRLFTEEGLASHGDVVEFYGPEGSGKTEMLYHLLVSCILPELAGGLQVEVLFIDTDYHFDMLRLVTILESRLPQGSEETVKGCLSRLYLVQCGGSTQLLLILHSLEAMVCSHPALCLLIMDSISAFYWMDKFSGGESISQQEASLRHCIKHLEKLLSKYHLVLVATTQAFMGMPGSGVCKSDGVSAAWLPPLSTAAKYKPYLCRSWQRLVKHRLLFSKHNNARDNKQEFTIVSLHPQNIVVSKCAFIVTDCGIQFL